MMVVLGVLLGAAFVVLLLGGVMWEWYKKRTR